MRSLGKGRVIWGPTAREVLAADGVPPDAEFLAEARWAAEAAPEIDYIHRRTEETDIYFVSNQGATRAGVRALFRVVGRQPEVWDPVSGRMHAAAAVTASGGRTAVPLDLPPYGSVFVVFRDPRPASRRATDATSTLTLSTVIELAGPWPLSFDPRWGGPAKVTFDKLEDWTKRPEPGHPVLLRHRRVSAVLRPSAEARTPWPQASHVPGLGDGQGAGGSPAQRPQTWESSGARRGAWRLPARSEQGNVLELEVVNFWPNRLIGDAALPPDHRRTATNITKFTADSPLMPSGLAGPGDSATCSGDAPP